MHTRSITSHFPGSWEQTPSPGRESFPPLGFICFEQVAWGLPAAPRPRLTGVRGPAGREAGPASRIGGELSCIAPGRQCPGRAPRREGPPRRRPATGRAVPALLGGRVERPPPHGPLPASSGPCRAWVWSPPRGQGQAAGGRPSAPSRLFSTRARAGAPPTPGDPAEPGWAPATHRDLAGRWALFHRGLRASSPAAAHTPAPRPPRPSDRGSRSGTQGRRRERRAGRGGPGCPSAESPPAAARRGAGGERGAAGAGRGGRPCAEGRRPQRRAAPRIPLGGGGRGFQEIQTLRQEIGILTKHSRSAPGAPAALNPWPAGTQAGVGGGGRRGAGTWRGAPSPPPHCPSSLPPAGPGVEAMDVSA